MARGGKRPGAGRLRNLGSTGGRVRTRHHGTGALAFAHRGAWLYPRRLAVPRQPGRNDWPLVS